MPPIPPHATWEQLEDMTTAVLKGDPNGWHLMVQGAKTKAQEFVPHRGKKRKDYLLPRNPDIGTRGTNLTDAYS